MEGGPAFVYGTPRRTGTTWEFPFVSRSADGRDDVVFVEVLDVGAELDLPVDDVVVQLLHVSIGLSYYKARPAPIVLDFPADPRVRPYLAALIANGLAEYAYTTGRRDALSPAITVPVERLAPDRWTGAGDDRTVLVPLGGGKDSVVTVDRLQRSGFDVRAFAVGEHPAIRACADVAGVPLTVVTRTLDPALAELTARTGLNGHVPVTAINSLVALLVARATGIGTVAMSNEASADEPTLTVDGLVVNHQWSKSSAYERLLQSALPAGLTYFSALRPWREIRIAQAFAAIGRFDQVALSCNNAYVREVSRRSPSWCLRCPKCAFVGLVLAPFLTPDRRVRMFGGDVLGSAATSTYLRSLVGLTDGKPLECVGEVLESRAALQLLVDAAEPLPDFVAAVAAELSGLMPTTAEIAGLFALDVAARDRFPAPFRHVLDAA